MSFFDSTEVWSEKPGMKVEPCMCSQLFQHDFSPILFSQEIIELFSVLGD